MRLKLKILKYSQTNLSLMTIPNLIFILLFFLFVGCNRPYSSFTYDGKSLFVCAQDDRAIVTGTPCNQFSENHLLLTWGGLTGGMKLLADFCESYSLTAIGEFDVIGEPKFNYKLLTWGEYVTSRDSIDTLASQYASSECMFTYSE